MPGPRVPREFRHPRREGAVTVRAAGKACGGVFLYRTDVPSSLVHSIVGQVVQGIELVRLAQEHDVLAVSVQPERIDLLGLPVGQAKEIAAARGFTLVIDKDAGSGSLSRRSRAPRWKCLPKRRSRSQRHPLDKVIDIELDDAACTGELRVFRRITGLVEHDAGMLPVFFKFDDVVLFKPEIPAGIKITPENMPEGGSPGSRPRDHQRFPQGCRAGGRPPLGQPGIRPHLRTV